MFKTFKEWLEAKSINKEAFEAKTIEEQASLQKEYMAYVSDTLKQNGATKEQIKSIEEKLEKLPKAEAIQKLQKDVSEALETLAQLKEKTEKGSLSDIDKYRLKKKIEEKHDEIVEAIKHKKPFEISFKAAAMHMTNNGTVSNGTVNYPSTDNFSVDSDIAAIRYPDNFILNVIPNRQVSKVPQNRIKTEQAPVEGSAAVTAEGAVKPLIQYKFVRTSTDRVKYAGRIEWTEEFEMDFEALFNAILRMFEQDVVRTWQNGILSQISTNATAYVSSTLDDTLPEPDNGLAIVAGQSQLQALNYMPDVVLINPSDLFPTMFQQDANGNLKLSPYINVTTGTINGMRLIQSNTIPQGVVRIGESSLYNEEHSDFILRTGQYADQLIENEYTAIGEIFSLLSIAERDLVGWLELDLATVKASLLKP